jgi:hypothetical protein
MAVLFALVLGACGGGGGKGATSATTAVPTTVVDTSTSLGPSSATTSTTVPGGSTSTTTGGALSASSTVTLRGIGPVRVGMTLSEASSAAGKQIVAKPDATTECGYAAPEGGPDGVLFMVVAGRIARVDVSSGPVKTQSGAAIGDTEAQAQARYSNRLQVSPHNYDPTGRYLTLVPSDPADVDFRLIFETDGTKVTRFRAGKQPEVSYVEGCS